MAIIVYIRIGSYKNLKSYNDKYIHIKLSDIHYHSYANIDYLDEPPVSNYEEGY